jgi:HAD superfamily hydrolase (TIGR01509 family)
MRLEMIDAVVFDLDGVLVDSEPLWENVRQGLVVEAGGDWPADAQQRLMGMNTGEWSRYLSQELGTGLNPEKTASVVIDRMKECYAHDLPLMPGAREAVRRFAERWPLGLASSSPPELIDVLLQLSDLKECFQAVLSSDEVDSGKPAPDIYQEVCRRLGIATQRAAAVEDSTNGLRSALSAGLRVIAVPHRRYPVDPQVLAQADAVVADLSRLTPELLSSLGE